MRVCGNCGNAQGPFDRLQIGPRRSSQWVFTCPVPKGDGLTVDERRAPVLACLARRAKKDAAA